MRSVFFSFHYANDVWRAANVRNSNIVDASAPGGFRDVSIWEEARLQGRAALEKLIGDAFVGTSVTAVLIGAQTASRPWVTYEIEQSIARGNGLLGIYVDGIKDQHGRVGVRGPVPQALVDARAQVYAWDRDQFGTWVEAAARAAGR